MAGFHRDERRLTLVTCCLDAGHDAHDAGARNVAALLQEKIRKDGKSV